MSGPRSIVLVLAVLGGSGCAATRGPSGYLQPAAVTQREAHGGWITLELTNRLAVEGELLAIHADTVYVLEPGDRLRPVPRAAVHSAILGTYDAQWGQLGIWTTFGSVATISHGWFLALTLPAWLIGGPLATGAASRAPVIRGRGTKPDLWTAMVPFARFPAGLPDGIDRDALRGRRVPDPTARTGRGRR